MDTSSEAAGLSSLDPTAPSFSMPPSAPSNDNPATTALPNGQSNPSKQPPRPEKGHSRSATAERIPDSGSGAGMKLTGAELKKQKAAEKAARRAEKVAEKGAQVQNEGPAPKVGPKPEIQRRLSGTRKDGEATHRRTGSMSGGGKPVPIRSGAAVAEVKDKPREEKKVAMFGHLYSKERKAGMAGTGKDVHPAVLALGLQIRDYVICGGNARCVAMLLAFKKVIQAYTTPQGMALSRHLTQHLSHQISYLLRARPLSIGQGNSIRWLKKLISALDPEISDFEAKRFLCDSIDQFIREKITLADELIRKAASARIVDGDVILTYAKSSIVEKAILTAHEQGKKFKVIVVDSRPLFEGKNLAKSLSAAGIEVEYALLSGISEAVRRSTKCVVGASAMTGNGRLYSRAGTAVVAMMAKDAGSIPVVVLCESFKFTGKVALDSIVMNELGDPDTLVESAESPTLTSTSQPTPPATKGKKGKEDDEQDSGRKGVEDWREQSNLHLLNLMYDVTPTQYLDLVVTECGSMPPSAISVVNGVNGDE